ncbi:SpoIIE family protein phosphatase [Nonomuraea jabiensis]|uniref:protein-serine/threonine phosphatase n=1 Tax=Nonomuraea jabiensis TaxID=882448 RepID=A0A7W9LCV6_9ACTN|nr:SpoIIE family protein phosphatase [Nonomuraea jabiensis]MBB5779156.1 serine phosphatase RsbU (regulator of sigma subunit)/PAS domain-containing protein [Nonomuraea jabiensis]
MNRSSVTASGEDRLSVLTSVCAGLSDIEVLEYALDQAVADLHALGGMIHWAGPVGSREPRLVAASGLPPAAQEAWDGTRDMIVRVLRDGTPACLPVSRSGLERPATAAAVPLRGPGPPFGVLSVLCDGAAEPTDGQREFLRSLAGWLARRLARTGADSGPKGSWWPERSTDSGLRKALKAVKIGSWDWNIRTGELYWDEPALTMLGIDPATRPHHIDTWSNIVHPKDLPRVMAATEEAIRTRAIYEVEYRACRPDGTTGWMHARGRLVLDERGEPVRMVGTVWDTTESRVARESAGRALRDMSDAFLAVDRDGRIMFVNLVAERLLGSSDLNGRVLWELAPARLPELKAMCRQVVAERVPASFDMRWPADERWYHVRLVPVPDGLTLYLADVTDKRIHDEQREAAEQAAAERSARIQELTRTLSDAVTLRDVMRVIAEQVLPPFGATGLAVLTREGDHLHLVESIGSPTDLLGEFQNGAAPVPSVYADVLRSHVPIFITSTAEQRPPGAGGPAGSRMDSWAILPLRVPDQPLGYCVISFDRPHQFTSEERTLLTALSGLIAQALARARMYDLEHTRAQELQRHLLPRALPSLPGLTAAARYLPGGTAAVGGDWYDIIPLSADRVALVIGDVMGHGLTEAVTMGRLRTAVRTLADLELPPGELLAHLNDLVSDLGDDSYVTCLYAVYDPTSGECVLASAGHPPPALVRPDGAVHVLDVTPDPPLGAAAPPLSTHELRVPEDSLLVFYTDGLIESSTRDIESGLAELTRLLTGLRRGLSESDLDRLCESVIEAMLPTRKQLPDDAALLIARAHRLPAEDVVSWALPDNPIAAREAREHVRDQLAAWHLDDLVTTTELVASELVGNVIRHAKGPLRLRLLRSRTLICEVADGSQTTPRIRRAAETDEGGRGLQLVAALSQRWGTRFTADGKCIWAEQALPAPGAA